MYVANRWIWGWVDSLSYDNIGEWKHSEKGWCQISKTNQSFWEIYIAKWFLFDGGESRGLGWQSESYIFCIQKQSWKHWKCKDPVTKQSKFIVYFMIILVDAKLESVRIQ